MIPFRSAAVLLLLYTSVSLKNIDGGFACFGMLNKSCQIVFSAVCLLARPCLSFVHAETWCSRSLVFLTIVFHGLNMSLLICAVGGHLGGFACSLLRAQGLHCAVQRGRGGRLASVPVQRA